MEAHFCSSCFLSSGSFPSMLTEASFTSCTARVTAFRKALMMACTEHSLYVGRAPLSNTASTKSAELTGQGMSELGVHGGQLKVCTVARPYLRMYALLYESFAFFQELSSQDHNGRCTISHLHGIAKL